MKPGIVVALTANPNSGKTTLFNALTGSRQHVGNYPGVTVERKEGTRRHNGVEFSIVDWLYLKKAGTIILGISILLWAMTTFPWLSDEASARFEALRDEVAAGPGTAEERQEHLATLESEEARAALGNSIAGRVGHALEPLLRPMGFDWRIGTALIGAFAAKEVFVAQMGIVYSLGETDEGSQTLREKLSENYAPLTGFCIMLFCLVSAPCMATIAVMKRESNSWGWALFQLAGLTLLAYVLTVAVFQAGSLLKIGIA